MDFSLLLTIFAFGLGLILVEIILIPGSTVIGLIGGVFLAIGVGATFIQHGLLWGFGSMLASVAVSGLAFWWVLKSQLWQGFTLKTNILSQVNTDVEEKLSIGMEGKSVSALRPSGKAEFDGAFFEVHSQKGYVASDTSIKIIDIENHKIFVEST